MTSDRQVRLRLIRPEAAKEPVQDCGSCKNQRNCWAPKIREEHAILNLLTCRLKRGIDINRSTKLFLQMVRPKLKTYAKIAVRGTNIDIEMALADLESQTIEFIRQIYIMGDRAYPLHFLFGQPNGHIKHYANNYARKTRKYEDYHTHLDGDELLEGQADTTVYEEQETPETQKAREVVDDGISMTLAEFRVLKFCLMNTTEAKRPLNGLHVYLARNMGVVRARVTRIYKTATQRVVQEVRESM